MGRCFTEVTVSSGALNNDSGGTITDASLILWFGSADELNAFVNPNVGKEILFADILDVDTLNISNGEFLATFGVGMEGGNPSFLYNNGVFADGWGFADSFSGLKYTSENIEPPAATPEPATLLMLGIGAIGAGFAAGGK